MAGRDAEDCRSRPCRTSTTTSSWAAAGVGIGLVYLDTLNHIVDVPTEVDGVSPARDAASAILVESIATAIAATLGAALIGRAVAGGGGTAAAVAVLSVAVLAAVATAWSARRVGPSGRTS